jgi:hypothetical protein
LRQVIAPFIAVNEYFVFATDFCRNNSIFQADTGLSGEILMRKTRKTPQKNPFLSCFKLLIKW